MNASRDTPPSDALTVFTPLPPERNGIADYAALLLGALANDYDCAAVCDIAACPDVPPEAPSGVKLLDPAQAHRRIGPGGRVLHQLGNNPGHGFVLRALRDHPGVTTLHDPGLLHDSLGSYNLAQGIGMAALILGAVLIWAVRLPPLIAKPQGFRAG